jgi:hypothetical protein
MCAKGLRLTSQVRAIGGLRSLEAASLRWKRAFPTRRREFVHRFQPKPEAADKARRATVLTGFVTAASLVVSLGAAWWSALRGGHHRDNQIPARFAVGAQRRLS